MQECRFDQRLWGTEIKLRFLTRSWDPKGLHCHGEGGPETYQLSCGIAAQVQADWLNQGISSLELVYGLVVPLGVWQNQVEILSEGRFLLPRPQIIQ